MTNMRDIKDQDFYSLVKLSKSLVKKSKNNTI